MSSENGALRGKRVVVLGASRGVGRKIVECASAAGARVLAVARQESGLAELAKATPGVDTLALDAAAEAAPANVFHKAKPDLLVICGGATPPVRPIPELSWAEFTINWEVDAKMAFLFCREALRTPLAPGSVVVIIASGAGLGGSPISGGYAGAKRMQMNPIVASSASASSRWFPLASCQRRILARPRRTATPDTSTSRRRSSLRTWARGSHLPTSPGRSSK